MNHLPRMLFCSIFAGLLDELQNPYLKPSLSMCAIVCLVDIASVSNTAWLASSTCQDQVNVADVLVGHKLDMASPEQIDAFEEWTAELFPPKLQVGCSTVLLQCIYHLLRSLVSKACK